MNCRLRFLFFFFFFLFFVPGRLQSGLLGDFSLQDEIELGEKFSIQIGKHFNLVHDPVITDYVQKIVDHLAEQLPPQPFPFRVQVVVNPALNAFAIAAGNVYVFTGLLLNAEHEAEIASVLAHEMGHVVHRHVAQNIERSSVVNLGSLFGVLAGMFLGGEGGHALAVGSLAGAQSTMLHYSRDNEREADHTGFNLLTKAGYNPQGMVQMFEKLRKMSWLGGSSIPSYLSTHPGLNERIGAISSRISLLEGKEKERPYKDEQFQKIQKLIRARYADPDKALVFFQGQSDPDSMDILGTGIVLSRLNRIHDAQPFFSRAILLEPRNPLFLREVGRFAFEYKNIRDSLDYLSLAVQLNASDFLARFFLARALAEKENEKQAIDEMEKVLGEVPYDWEVHMYLGRYYGAVRDYYSAHLHLASSFFYKGEDRKAAHHLKEAEALATNEEKKKKIEEVQSAWKKWKGD